MAALMIGDGLPSNQIVMKFILFSVGNVNVCEGINIDVTKQIHDTLMQYVKTTFSDLL